MYNFFNNNDSKGYLEIVWIKKRRIKRFLSNKCNIRSRKILETVENHSEKMWVRVNVRMPKTMCMPIKLGMHTSVMHANC